MADVEKRRRAIINVAYFAMVIAIGLLVVRYAMGVCLPFVFAFIVAALLQRPKNFLVKKTFLKDGAASGICVLFAILILIALVVLIGVRIAGEIKGFVDYLIIQFQDIETVIDNVEAWIINLFASFPDFLRKTLSENTSEIFSQFRKMIAGEQAEAVTDIAGQITSKFSFSWISTPLSGVISTAKQLPSVFIAIIISIIACCFMTSEYPKIVEFIKCQFPENRRKDLSRAKALLKDSLGKMGKAYLLIICVTFAEMSIGLTVLRLTGIFESNYIVIIAAITAIVDILPVLGTGTIIIPWAAYSLIMGDFAMAIGLVVIYAVITVIRQIIEPKLVAGQLGLSPIITIAALYFGLKIFGVLGMFITPILVIMLKLLNDEGIINLWKSPSREKAKLEKEKQSKAQNS